MEAKEYYSKLSDYLILNGYSKNNSGLYYGKAGLAVGLFELSRYLNDERIENHAFELLNQSLISKTEVCDLEKGLSGIAYALRYLVENRFIEADANELIGDKLDKIAIYIGDDSDKWQERMDKLYALLYAFGKDEFMRFQSCMGNAAILWEKNTEEMLNDLSHILTIDSPLTQELQRRFTLWIQWLRRAEMRGIASQINETLISETIITYQRALDSGLLLQSHLADYFLSSNHTTKRTELFAIAEAISTQDRIIDSFCNLSDKGFTDPIYIQGDKTEKFIQDAMRNNIYCSTLKGGLTQLLMYEIAVEDPSARERLSELILLPDIHEIKGAEKQIFQPINYDEKTDTVNGHE